MIRRVIVMLAALLGAATAAADGVTLPDVQRVELGNGTVLLINQKDDVPLVGVSIVLRGGAAADPEDRHGLGSLYAELIQKGAGDRDSLEFAEAIDSVGGRMYVAAGREGVTITAEFLSRDVDLMLELLSDMLMRPTLDRAEFERIKERSINLLLAAKDSDPGQLMPTYAHAFLFGEHPYGNPVEGSESSLANISHADIVDYFEQQVGGDRLIIAVSGDIDAAEVETQLAATFGEWRAAATPLAEVIAAEPATGRRVLLIDKPGTTQTYFWIGNLGVAIDYPDRAALDLANTVFGGRFTSMLNNALRVESGLTYGARSRLVRPSQPGSVAISSFTATDTTVEAIDLALDVLARFKNSGVSAELLDSAGNYVLGQYPMRLETATQLAMQFTQLEAYGLGTDYVDGYADAVGAVTAESVATVIDAVYPSADELVFVLLGDAELIREQVARYGEITEMAITAPAFHPPPDEPPPDE
ncbi:MAG: pitrilysin family protein [Woeseiaceae bacterium]|nr:pitrilysin family protein [Woeseiaceae bacterium]